MQMIIGGLFIMKPYAIYLRKSRDDIAAERSGGEDTLARHEMMLTELAKQRGYLEMLERIAVRRIVEKQAQRDLIIILNAFVAKIQNSKSS